MYILATASAILVFFALDLISVTSPFPTQRSKWLVICFSVLLKFLKLESILLLRSWRQSYKRNVVRVLPLFRSYEYFIGLANGVAEENLTFLIFPCLTDWVKDLWDIWWRDEVTQPDEKEAFAIGKKKSFFKNYYF